MLYKSHHIHVLTIIITNFNCALIWFHNADGIGSTSLQIKDSHGSAMSSLMIGITTWLLELRCVCTLVNSSFDPSVKVNSLPEWAVSKGQRDQPPF